MFMMLDGVTLFLASKTYEIYVNACVTVEVLSGISTCKGGKSFRLFQCVRIEIDAC